MAVLLVGLLASVEPHADSAAQVQSPADEYEHAFGGAAPELIARRKSILEEVATPGANEWAGRYFADTTELSFRCLMWAPKSGYLLYLYADIDQPLDPSVGQAGLEGELLRLRPEVPIVNDPAPAYRDTFQLVRWGQRHFLVAPDDLASFCVAVNSTAEDEIERFLRKSEQVPEPVGLPLVPPSHTKYLRLRPISARVTDVRSDRVRVNEWPMYRVFVTLNAGEAQGVVPDMAFWMSDPRRKSRMKLRVTTVDSRTSEATVVEVWAPQTDDSYFPRRGMRFRTRPAKRDRRPWGG